MPPNQPIEFDEFAPLPSIGSIRRAEDNPIEPTVSQCQQKSPALSGAPLLTSPEPRAPFPTADLRANLAFEPTAEHNEQLRRDITEIETSGSGFPEYSAERRPGSIYQFEPAFPEWDNLVDIWYTMYPDIRLYPWQVEELLRMSGYTTGRLDGPRVHFDPHQAYRAAYVTVNGSGKDMVLIATAAIGLPLLYKNVFVVITSASHEQLKYQTSRHIVNGITQLNKRLGFKVYDSVEFYHRCEARGGEIKLFVTDEEGRAEGWHPLHPAGRLILIVNEAKSIPPAVFTALDRCSGYSHWIEVSSPGSRRGLFYKNHLNAIGHPNIPRRGRYFTRKVHQRECPHKSEEDRANFLAKHGLNSYAYQTSVLCNFWEQESEVAIPASLIETCSGVIPVRDDNDIGIGGDIAAGGDESSFYVRAGAQRIHEFHFHERNLVRAVDRIDNELSHWKNSKYVFNFDDNGLGKGPADMLVERGWNVTRRANQSRASDPAQFLNLGAEMYFHLRRLFEHGFIRTPLDELLIEQLITRKYDESETQGKKALESKRTAKSSGSSSPDRADAFVLCYFSYRPNFRDVQPQQAQRKLMTTEEFLAACMADHRFVENLLAQGDPSKRVKGDFTFQTFNP